VQVPSFLQHPAQTVVQTTSPEQQQRRKARLMSRLTDGLPALPSRIFELNKLLSSPSVDLRRVGKVIRNDPNLSTQVLRLCNSSLFSLRRRPLDIEEAAILVGSERLRTLVLTCSIMEFTCEQLPRTAVQTFWQHSFMSGMLSERVARWIDYSEREQAYLGGLIHDIGALPLLIVAKEENALGGEAKSGPWGGSLEAEKEYFGMTHCEAGRRIGQCWNLFPSFIDVFENHHHPERSVRDPHLVGIVAAADLFAEWRGCDPLKEEESMESGEPESAAEDEFLKLCFPRLDAKARSDLTEMLETEYLHLLPVIEFNGSIEPPLAERQV
jgi:HD-like signal output (HDOD) protein